MNESVCRHYIQQRPLKHHSHVCFYFFKLIALSATSCYFVLSLIIFLSVVCSLTLIFTLLFSLSFLHPPSTGEWRLSCRTNPLVIPVSHDLSVAFYHTKAIRIMFASPLVAISGVGLRSFQSFDPITISGCQSNEIYNPTGQR